MQRTTIMATTIALAGALTACGTSEEPETTETTEPTETTVTAAVSEPELPASISGYSDEAKSDMAEDNLAEADVQSVVDAARDGRAEVEFDDGHFELEFNDIDVDITPDGMVTEADR